MTNPIGMTVTEKNQLKRVFTIAMEKANQDRVSVGEYFKEESFRYITMTEISNLKKWGTFPNNTKRTKLIFEFNYKKYKKKTKSLLILQLN